MASSAQAKKFINTIAPIIQEEAKKRGYLVCSPIIAQACIESAFGTSALGYKWHNYFGMKCGSLWRGKSINLRTKEEYNSRLVPIRDNFRVYDSMEEGVVGYFDFISAKRYANLKTAETANEYLERIKADGYATSSAYVNTNMNCVLKYDLEEWDWLKVSDTKTIEEIAKEVVDGKWGNGTARKEKLTAAGYDYKAVQKAVNKMLMS